MSDVTCPKCSGVFEVQPVAIVPKEQSMAIKLSGDSDYFCATTIGETIINMEKILSGVAKNMGTPVVVFIKSIDLTPGQAEIRFFIAAKSSNAKSDQ